MAVPNLPAYKSDPLSISPNPKETNVLAEGTLTFTDFVTVSAGYVSYETITLSTGDKGTANIPVFDYVHYINYGGGVYLYRPGPYVNLDWSTGAVSSQLSCTIYNQIVSGNTYEVTLNFFYFVNNNSSGNKDSAYYTQYGYYKVYSNSWGNIA